MIKDHGMHLALIEAQKAFDASEVPVGCVIIWQDKVIAKTFNQTLLDNNPCSHAEILAITEACKKIGNHRLIDCDLYVTLEPCLMCIGAMIQARIRRLYYATKDSRVGILSKNILQNHIQEVNHRMQIIHDQPFEERASRLLKTFFQQKR